MADKKLSARKETHFVHEEFEIMKMAAHHCY